ncbi:hypothetical protein B0H16DRAFT_1548857 [Mycena metata]|uniref:Uncharacterized protein n=1 Tax=Mycena metata TaxID=1033252 RepID=A0AAD7IVB6_9AGAR|nr:hypothetical protein B0H16DRAFT_1548857 [Mycena metata]
MEAALGRRDAQSTFSTYAADMLLIGPGLSAIVRAICGSRVIFQRMRNYSVYARIVTIRIVVCFAILAFAYTPGPDDQAPIAEAPSVNSAVSLSLEATRINQSFGLQGIVEGANGGM